MIGTHFLHIDFTEMIAVVILSNSKCFAAETILHHIDIRVVNPYADGWQQCLRMPLQQLERIDTGCIEINVQGKKSDGSRCQTGILEVTRSSFSYITNFQSAKGRKLAPKKIQIRHDHLTLLPKLRMVSPIRTFRQAFPCIKARNIDVKIEGVTQCTGPLTEISKATTSPHSGLNQRHTWKAESTGLLDSENCPISIIKTLKAIIKDDGL